MRHRAAVGANSGERQFAYGLLPAGGKFLGLSHRGRFDRRFPA